MGFSPDPAGGAYVYSPELSGKGGTETGKGEDAGRRDG